MQKDNRQQTTFCHSCGRNILTSNFLIHEGRCQRMSELKSSRVSEDNQKNVKSQDIKIPSFTPYQSRKQPYSYPKMQIKQDFRNMKKKPAINQSQQKIPCPFCGYMQTLLELDSHPQKCQHREVGCNFCGTKYPKSLMDQHSYICQKNPRNLQRNNRQRMRRTEPQSYQNIDEQDDGMPMIFQNRNRNMYRPSSLMDLLDQTFFSGGMSPYEQQRRQSPHHHYQVFQFSSSSNNGQPRVIFRTNSTNPATFIQLIEMLVRQANPNQNPGLNQQQLSRLSKVHYHKKNEEPDLCTICYCEFEQNEEIIELSCKHIFHQECIFEWLKRVSTCPVCKKKLKQGRHQQQEQFEQFQDTNQHRHYHNQESSRRQNQGGFFNFFPF